MCTVPTTAPCTKRVRRRNNHHSSLMGMFRRQHPEYAESQSQIKEDKEWAIGAGNYQLARLIGVLLPSTDKTSTRCIKMGLLRLREAVVHATAAAERLVRKVANDTEHAGELNPKVLVLSRSCSTYQPIQPKAQMARRAEQSGRPLSLALQSALPTLVERAAEPASQKTQVRKMNTACEAIEERKPPIPERKRPICRLVHRSQIFVYVRKPARRGSPTSRQRP